MAQNKKKMSIGFLVRFKDRIFRLRYGALPAACDGTRRIPD